MRHLVIIIAILAFVGIYDVNGQDIDSPKPFVLHLSHDSDPSALWITYYMTGSFGGYGSFVRTYPKVWDYELETSHQGLSARNMKLIVNSSKYKAQIFDFLKLKDQDRTLDLKLEPRSTLRFTGKVVSKEWLTDKRLQMRVGYLATWKCDYFGLIDCMLGADPVISVSLDRNGRFEVELPDFANDPVIASFGDKGAFLFDIRDKKTGNIMYRLRPENGRKGLDEIPVASSYPAEQVFIAERSN